MYYVLVVINVLVAAIAQMLLKKGALGKYPSWWREYLNFWVITGYGLMFASMVSNIFCLGNGVEIKQLCIIEGLNYLFVPLLSLLLFKERITVKKALAISIIMGGIVVFFM